MAGNGKKAATYKQYLKIFNTYNISAFTPKDMCDRCVAYENSSPEEKEKTVEKYEEHILNKDIARLEIDFDKCKTSSSTHVAIFDLQAVLPCPMGTASSFYYVSKVAVYNLTVTDIKKMRTVCYTWDETNGKRGGTEISTCVYLYLKSLNEDAGKRNEELDVIFYTDNCTGQNRNQFVKTMYTYAVKNLKHIRSITHKFLVVGHTQNEGDSAHSLIEAEVKKALKNGPLFVPTQYYAVMKQVRKTEEYQFCINELGYRDFINWKALPASDKLQFGNTCAYKIEKKKKKCCVFQKKI